jgi:RNA polymerase-binding transcription factor DksA
MTATARVTSRASRENLDDEALARLRGVLAADRATQTALMVENQAIADALTGQRDVDSILERELAEASVAHSRDAINDIDDAIERIGSGTYGLCESCQSPIPFARLEAIPRARCCVACSAQVASRLS